MTIYANDCRIFSTGMLRCFCLIACWIIGLLIGYFFSEPFSFSLMRSAAQQPVSIVGLFIALFYPLICTYFSFLTEKPIVVLIVCFLKAVAFGFSGALISQYFQSAGWIVCLLLMFSDCCFVCVLLILWLRCFSGVSVHPMSDLFVCAVIGICIAAADYFIISPFLQGLL